MYGNWKYIKKTEEYKYVYEWYHVKKHITAYSFSIKFLRKGNNKSVSKLYDTKRLAAKAVDLYLIKKGKEPVNIMKRYDV